MLQTLGLNLSLLLASGAALFVGIGLGLQNTFNDIISGFILLFEGSLLVGDIVEIESLVGRVEQIDIRTSKIKTRDEILIVVPNSKLINNNVINWTNSDALTRFNVSVGVAYGSNTELVKTTLEKVVLKHPEVSNKKPVRVRFENFGDSSLDFKVFFWTDRTWEIEFIKSELRFEIDKAFRANNITIPFPQRDLHIISNQAK
jgi:small-conductance mechanosensitive channel